MRPFTEKFKKIFFAAAVLFAFAQSAYAGDIVINGERMTSEAEPYIENGRTLVPLRFISENLGADVDFDDETRLVSVNKDDVSIELTLGSNAAFVNDEEITLDAASSIKDGRTMVPLRFIAEAFDCKVDYEKESKLVFVADKDFNEEFITPDNIPEFSGEPFISLYYNVPLFENADIVAFEDYSPLDELGRCGTANACIGKELMPTEKRGSIGNIRPSGWNISKYDFIDGKYLFNRCHLIAFMLAGENDNALNLITGTRYMNTEGMLPFETEVCDYVKRTGNHVMYRVTPVYTNDRPIADGVIMQAYSVEDNGKGVSFDIFAYNVQPGVKINYENGENSEDTEIAEQIRNGTYGKTTEETTETTTEETTKATAEETAEETTEQTSESIIAMETVNIELLPVDDNEKDFDYIVNTHTLKFHYPSCKAVEDMSDKNKAGFNGDREELTENGYVPCGMCRP